MTGMSPFTGAPAAKAGLYAAAKAALEGESVDVAYGFRWPLLHNDWAVCTRTESILADKASAPGRQQQETITLTMSIGSWKPGGDSEAEIASSNRAFEILQKIQAHIRDNDITLGGSVLWCMPGDSVSDGMTEETDAGFGRITEISAEFVCAHRIKP